MHLQCLCHCVAPMKFPVDLKVWFHLIIIFETSDPQETSLERHNDKDTVDSCSMNDEEPLGTCFD